ncbi:AtpZ/AtpI family protein [Hydrogenovibrio sp. 3SP14C1]|uniref:AtpZ/AtpI family protein n=1 Tax=Hydrogenovibrio sp. 3SP14C1 TaxID=3038774 RepID=UPI002415F265|nr:AtpZ/AtpI family protein [Hydrogenovibrio sp. 3SP14C1]MDG4811563.1 AtpZ/AtpI family protein [Hydrogenovibrio sp. 3SP14C1]
MSTEQKPVKKSSRQNKPALNFLLLSAGSMFTSMIVAGFMVGYVFDLLFDTMPLFLLSFGVLGFIGGMMKVHKLLGKMDLLDTPSKTQDTQEKSNEKNASE